MFLNNVFNTVCNPTFLQDLEFHFAIDLPFILASKNQSKGDREDHLQASKSVKGRNV